MLLRRRLYGRDMYQPVFSNLYMIRIYYTQLHNYDIKESRKVYVWS